MLVWSYEPSQKERSDQFPPIDCFCRMPQRSQPISGTADISNSGQIRTARVVGPRDGVPKEKMFYAEAKVD